MQRRRDFVSKLHSRVSTGVETSRPGKSSRDDGGPATGAVVLSLDAELAWGFHDLDPMPTERVEVARNGWWECLSLFDEFGIPATWSIVGNVFLDGTRMSSDGGVVTQANGPETAPKNWFGPDLIRAVQNAEVGHEIGCHTFLHLEFGDATTTRQAAAAELRESVRVANEWNIDFDSFVFPRNNVGHRELLAEFDFRCYRGTAPTLRYEGHAFEPLAKLVSMSVGRNPPPLVTPRIDEFGLVNVPASLFLFSLVGLPNRILSEINADPVVQTAKRGIDAAASSGGILHLWLHPNNLTDAAAIGRMRAICDYLAKTAEETSLEILTMREVAERTLTAEANERAETDSADPDTLTGRR